MCDQSEDGGLPIDYPHFSPPGGVLSSTLPDPRLSLPAVTAEQSIFPFGQHSLTPQANSQTTTNNVQMGFGIANSGLLTAEHSAEHSADALTLRVQHWESLCRDLQKEKHVMEEQFGQQRRKFMNLMVQKDKELSTVRQSVERVSSEALQLRKELMLKDEEICNIGAVTKAVESANREAFDADRVKYEEEIASLQRIIAEERTNFQREKEALLHGNVVSVAPPRSASPGDPSLDSEMAKAVQESKVLKAVVVPLEEEIDHLRLQLDEAKERLQHVESVSKPDTPPLIDLDTPFPFGASPLPDSLSPSDSKQLHRQLELERSARHDLEMHTKTLEEQKGQLQEENFLLQNKYDELNNKFATQQESYQQLQQTWDQANAHFIVAQDRMRQQMYFMEQKHHLKQQLPQEPTLSDSDSELLRPVASATVQSPSSEQQMTALRRSHSYGEIKEVNCGSTLQVLALENELKRVRQRLEQQSATCESYEAQLQRVQEQMLEELDEKDQELSRLREECSKARAGVMRERKAKEELRHKMEEACENSKLQVEQFQAGMQAQQAKLKGVKEQYMQTKHEAQRELARFSDERVSLYAQISSAQEEYDCLKVVQAEETQNYAQCIADMKKECSMAEDKARDLQLRLSELQQENQAVLESLEIQLHMEQKAKEGLSQQLEAARNQIVALELVKAELGQEQQMKEKAMAARSDVEEKSRVFIAEQHRKLEEEVASRQAAEQQVRDLQRQMASLRAQLNTSQENQKDFVELSQALQVKLAKIEEEQETNSPSHPP